MCAHAFRFGRATRDAMDSLDQEWLVDAILQEYPGTGNMGGPVEYRPLPLMVLMVPRTVLRAINS
jgi:hypothetical protein